MIGIEKYWVFRNETHHVASCVKDRSGYRPCGQGLEQYERIACPVPIFLSGLERPNKNDLKKFERPNHLTNNPDSYRD